MKEQCWLYVFGGAATNQLPWIIRHAASSHCHRDQLLTDHRSCHCCALPQVFHRRTWTHPGRRLVLSYGWFGVVVCLVCCSSVVCVVSCCFAFVAFHCLGIAACFVVWCYLFFGLLIACSFALTVVYHIVQPLGWLLVGCSGRWLFGGCGWSVVGYCCCVLADLAWTVLV